MDYQTFSDRALLDRLRGLAASERCSLADFVACLDETDRRGAALGEGYASLFDFCTRDLKLAESTAYQRLQAARAARDRPEVLAFIESGEINLTNLTLIASHLKGRPDLLHRIKGKRKRDVEKLVAELGAEPPKPDQIRSVRIETPSSAGDRGPQLELAQTPSQTPPCRPAAAAAMEAPRIESLVEFRFQGEPGLAQDIERLRALLWHRFPQGRLSDLIGEAVRSYLERTDPAKPRRLSHKRPAVKASRRIRKAIQREIWRRDGGRCTFEGPAGRCPETRGLEIDHIEPWAKGGRSDDPSNLRLLCRGHNQWAARQTFGELPLS